MLAGQPFIGLSRGRTEHGYPLRRQRGPRANASRPRRRAHRYVLQFRVFPLRDRSGVVDGVLVAGFDVTREVFAARELEEAQQLFKSVVDNVPELAWTALADGHIDYYNERWYEYTGTTFEQMEGWGWQASSTSACRCGEDGHAAERAHCCGTRAPRGVGGPGDPCAASSPRDCKSGIDPRSRCVVHADDRRSSGKRDSRRRGGHGAWRSPARPRQSQRHIRRRRADHRSATHAQSRGHARRASAHLRAVVAHT